MGNSISIQDENIKYKLLGLTFDEAKILYPNLRIIEIDGLQLSKTNDYSINRCNIIIKNELVFKVDGFY
jgi:hypothetical protein